MCLSVFSQLFLPCLDLDVVGWSVTMRTLCESRLHMLLQGKGLSELLAEEILEQYHMLGNQHEA